MSNLDEDLFKPVFKYYKSKVPAPSFDEVIDINTGQNVAEKLIMINPEKGVNNDEFLIDSKSWRCFKMSNGVFILRNPFTDLGIAYWLIRCVQDFSKEKNNLSKDFVWFDEAQRDPKLVSKLRWATLGYHHDWDTKVYQRESVSGFPRDLAKLAQTILTCVGHPSGLDYRAEAAIVNYYPMDSTLSGHVDHSEPNKSAPLVSISLGQSAIFLIGGPSKATKPDAVLLRNGDVLIMTEQARQSYHAVPRIVQADLEVCSQELLPGFIKTYVGHHRINMNVRQVF